MKTFLFQCDSITDAGRERNDAGSGSYGYPTFTAGQLGAKYPGQLRFINRGISGNRVVDLYARIKTDFININPDYLSILIGINDVWHEIGGRNGVDNAKFFRVYCALIEEIKTMCPDTEIFILEPFVLEAAATQNDWGVFRSETEMRAESARKVAEKYSLCFIPLQKLFDDACEKAEPSFWLMDGVHPTPAGHELITRELIRAFEETL